MTGLLKLFVWAFISLSLLTVTNCENSKYLIRTGRSRVKYGPSVPGPPNFWFGREAPIRERTLSPNAAPSALVGRSEPTNLLNFKQAQRGDRPIPLNRNALNPNDMMIPGGRDGRGLFDWLWGGWYYDYPPPPPPQVRFPPPPLLEELEYCEELYDPFHDEYFEDCVPVYKSDKFNNK